MTQASKHRPETPAGGSQLVPPLFTTAIPPLLSAAGALSLEETQRQAFQEELRQRTKNDAQQKLDWLRALSHELRTPLNAIGGFVQLLRSGARGEVPEKMRSDLDRIERNQQHMARLIDEVLMFARLDAGRVPFEIAAFPVARLLLDLSDCIPRDEKARGRHVTVQRCANDVVVRADEDRARQVLLQLIGNALKHTPSDARIEVVVDAGAARDTHVRIAVRDDGPGIPADALQNVFEPFYQVGRSMSRPVEGLGLGLTVARALARGMGGDLTARSGAGTGATFVFALRRDF